MRLVTEKNAVLTYIMTFGKYIGMKAIRTQLKVGAAGRVVLPQRVRENFHLVHGATLDMEIQADAIILRPSHQQTSLAEEGSLLVHEGKPTDELLDVVSHVRQNRDRIYTFNLRDFHRLAPDLTAYIMAP